MPTVQCAFCGTSYELAEAGGVLALRPIRESLENIEESAQSIAHHSSRTDDATTVAALRIQNDALEKDLESANKRAGAASFVLLVILGIAGNAMFGETGLWCGAVAGFIIGALTGVKRIIALDDRLKANRARIRDFEG